MSHQHDTDKDCKTPGDEDLPKMTRETGGIKDKSRRSRERKNDTGLVLSAQ